MATWDTDLRRNTTTTLIGGYSIEFMANKTAEIYTRYYPVETGKPYRAKAILQTSLAGANDKMRVYLRWYTKAKAYISQNVVHADGPLNAANVWETKAGVFTAPATAAYAVINVAKTDTTTGYVGYCDYAGITPHPPAFKAYLDADTNHASLATIVCDVEVFDHGSNYNNATGIFTAPESGTYFFKVSATADDLDAGEYAILGFKVNGNITEYGQTVYAHNANDSPGFSAVMAVELDAGDTVLAFPAHDHGGGNLLLLGDAGTILRTVFSGYMIERPL